MATTVTGTETGGMSATAGLMERLRAGQVRTEDELYGISGQPHPAIREKHTSYMTPLIMDFIRAAPFFLIATADGAGNCDVSPKGDPAGAVVVIDERTLAIPDRPGNRRVDGHRNLLQNPHMGLIFIIPGVDETLRVNGRAFLTADTELLGTMLVQGKAPKLATIIEIDEVYMHCARAFLRSGMWKPEKWPDPDTIPTLGAIMCEQKDLPAPDESQGKRREEYRNVLY